MKEETKRERNRRILVEALDLRIERYQSQARTTRDAAIAKDSDALFGAARHLCQMAAVATQMRDQIKEATK